MIADHMGSNVPRANSAFVKEESYEATAWMIKMIGSTMDQQMKRPKTKIFCTLGPGSRSVRIRCVEPAVKSLRGFDGVEEIETNTKDDRVTVKGKSIDAVRIELMEQDLFELQQLLSGKKEQEKAMLDVQTYVLLKVEQDQKITEDAHISAERDAAAQEYLEHSP
ncbi:hypothetical protein M8C21_004272 [Ambrosia artemisiifolia]|uniref:Uncharacterized protein n=1 Tax=Ambrosia artemisiifolia TaxID=4212 RepID=A0AAD5CW08_AMBAR|nr:hypothetical protein M8C21_004272 [Ambrosia artemisiifolia]